MGKQKSKSKRTREAVLSLSAPDTRCQFCNKKEQETEQLQYAHIIPNKITKNSIRLENGFALCGDNGDETKHCHAKFDKIAKPRLLQLSQNRFLVHDWFTGNHSILGDTQISENEDKIRYKLSHLVGWVHPTANWPVYDQVSLLRTLDD